MCNLKKTKAVLFDLDGTLWDAADTIARVWSSWCREHGIARVFTPAECRSYCGKTLEQIAALVFPELPPARREQLLLGCCLAENPVLSIRGGILYPDLIPVLQQLRERCLLAVVSNCQAGYVEAFFAGNQTGYLFDDYECAGRSGLSKGENIRLVLARNGVERAVYVGDTDGDQAAARFAGVPFIHAAYGFGTVSGADAVIRSLRQLPTAAARLLGEEIAER